MRLVIEADNELEESALKAFKEGKIAISWNPQTNVPVLQSKVTKVFVIEMADQGVEGGKAFRTEPAALAFLDEWYAEATKEINVIGSKDMLGVTELELVE